MLRLAGAVSNLIWGEEDVTEPLKKKSFRSQQQTQPKKKRIVRQENSALARLTRGQAARQRDVNGNTKSALDALESLLDDKTGNSEVGANFLRRLIFEDVDDDEENAVGKKSFDPGPPNQDLMDAVAKLPEERTKVDLKTINRHLGWHPFFQVARGRLKKRMLRHVRLCSPEQFSAVVLQGESADAAYIVYSGRLSVNIKNDGGVALSKYQKKPLAKDLLDYHKTIEQKVGCRVAYLRQGNAFGENGFLENGAKRNATVIALDESTHLFQILRDDVLNKAKPGRLLNFEGAPHRSLVDVLNTDAQDRSQAQIDTVLHHVSWQPFFTAMEESLARVACRHLRMVEVPRDQTVVIQGDIADCYFIVYHGQAEVYVTKNEKSLHTWKGLNLWRKYEGGEDARSTTTTPREVLLPVQQAGKEVFVLQQGMAFGESGLDPSGPMRRTATVVSRGCALLALYREDVQTVFPPPSPAPSPPKLPRRRRLASIAIAALRQQQRHAVDEKVLAIVQQEETRYSRGEVIVKLDRRKGAAAKILRKVDAIPN